MKKNEVVTATLVAKIKAEAKRLAKLLGIQHSVALEMAARQHGFTSWYQLPHHRVPAAPESLEIDPKLPPDFECTANDQRSIEDLNRWWDRPFALTRTDGRLEVRCLDGGAWDRSTYYGVAANLEEANAIAREKLRAWRRNRAAPVVLIGEGKPQIAVLPQRPDQMMQVLRVCQDGAEPSMPQSLEKDQPHLP